MPTVIIMSSWEELMQSLKIFAETENLDYLS